MSKDLTTVNFFSSMAFTAAGLSTIFSAQPKISQASKQYNLTGIDVDVWDTLYAYAPTPLAKKILDSLLRLFTIVYAPTVKEKRRFLLYYAVSVCCETISMECELIQDKKLIEHSYEKCWIMYKDIRKHEVS